MAAATVPEGFVPDTAAAKTPDIPKGRGIGGDILHGLGLATGFSAPENRLEELESIAASALPIGMAGRLVGTAARGATRLPGLVKSLAPTAGRVGASSALEGGKAAAQGRPVGEAAGAGAVGAIGAEMVGGVAGKALGKLARPATEAAAAKTAGAGVKDRVAQALDDALTRVAGAKVPKGAKPIGSSGTAWIEAPVLGPKALSWDEAMRTIQGLQEPTRSVAIKEVAQAIGRRDKTAASLFAGAFRQAIPAVPAASGTSHVAKGLQSASPTLQAVADSAASQAANDPIGRPTALGVASEMGSIPSLLRRVPGVKHVMPGGGH